MKQVWTGLIGLLFGQTNLVFADTVKLNVYAYSETLGKQLITYKPSDDGYKYWMRSGYEYAGCKDKDFSEFYPTSCMIKANLTAAEKSLADLGLNVKFEYKLIYTDFVGYDVKCESANCITGINWAWKPTGHDVLFLPRWNGSQEHTRTFKDNTSVITLTAGKGQIFQTAQLVRHGLAHMMGFDYHLYDDQPWVYQGCGKTITVQPYAKSGLKKSCENSTFLGNWTDASKPCGNISASDPHLYDTKWNVPLYGPIFKQVFSCWLAENNKDQVPAPLPNPEKQICVELKKLLVQNGCHL